MCQCVCVCLSIAAVRRPVEFGEGEELNAAEGELPASHVFLDVVHPAAVPGKMNEEASNDTNADQKHDER